MNQLEPSRPAPRPTNSALTGFRIGVLFASPFLLIIWLAIIARYFLLPKEVFRVAMYQSIQVLVISLSGWWWGKRGLKVSKPGLFGAALVQGMISTGLFLGSLSLTFWQFKQIRPHINGVDIRIFLIGSVVSALFFLALGLSIRWRVSNLLIRA
jgi:hypothetical protein